MRRGEPVEDKEIVDLYWQRNENAIKETSLKYGKYCLSIATHILCNINDAEESVNDTWLNAWNSMPPHRPENLSSYLGKITRYICLKKWRYQNAQKRGGSEISIAFDELSDCIPDGKSIDEALQLETLTGILNTFISGLPKVERRVFVCRYWYFNSILEISQQFGFSQSKVKTMLWRTRKKLMIQLKKDGVFYES